MLSMCSTGVPRVPPVPGAVRHGRDARATSMQIDRNITAKDLRKQIGHTLELAGRKARLLDRSWDTSKGTPVFTVEGKYTTRGWTEWTQGFQYGCAILAFDGTGEQDLLELGRKNTLEKMAPHVTHVGVHD